VPATLTAAQTALARRDASWQTSADLAVDASAPADPRPPRVDLPAMLWIEQL